MSKKLLRILLIIIAAACVVVCAVSIIFIWQYKKGLSDHEALVSQVKSSFSTVRDKSQTEDDAQLPEATEEPVVDLPVDFAALEEINPDIYAWVEIPCTTINYPVLQHPTKDEYYNDHGADGKYSPYGSIFSQASYNGRDFHEPVTVLYGHNLVYGMENMFAMLNNYADADFFDAHDTIYIYTPDSVLEYRVFAAYVHSNEHILAYRDFTDAVVFDEYFKSMRETDDVYSNFNDEYMPAAEDRVLTLSTCFNRNNRQRYIVQAVLVDEMKAVFNPADSAEGN